jgi:hypothetical protein
MIRSAPRVEHGKRLTAGDGCDVPSTVIALPEPAVVTDVALDKGPGPVIEDRLASSEIRVLGRSASHLVVTTGQASEGGSDRCWRRGSEESAGGEDEGSGKHGVGDEVKMSG